LESIDIAYDEDKVYTASDDGCAYQWDLTGVKPLLKYFTFEGSVRKVAVSAHFFAAACTDGIIRVHHKLSGECFKYFKHGNTQVWEVRISKDETKLWSAASNGSIACFNLITCETIYRRRHHSSWIWSMCLMNNEKILVTGSGNGSIDFLNAITGDKLVQLYNLPWDNEFLASSPPDNALPNGFFYTTNKDFIEVVKEDKSTNIKEKLELNDPRRIAYINKLNLKNLIITRLKNNEHYVSLTDKYMQNQKLLQRIDFKRLPQMLKA
jgi:WD40 repeat protein